MNGCVITETTSRQGTTNLQVTGKPNLLQYPDEPLSGVVLVPLYGITIVHRELVMEVVVTFTNSRKSCSEVISWSMLVIEGRFAEPVGKRVDTESGLHVGMLAQ